MEIMYILEGRIDGARLKEERKVRYLITKNQKRLMKELLIKKIQNLVKIRE